ncbi:hypothetical protein BZG36_03356 [Bifiguratus adelaidae]|uniref:Alpha/beta hydrolase fold-3 domain-containing protein n=1 Tax=Bifiguratus adelaidae TaxID=1938954 RepID=A0A261XWL4_9FUNG|nr:hypothetical protein BZG36_03356 [Bifiguratus adelaidae]
MDLLRSQKRYVPASVTIAILRQTFALSSISWMRYIMNDLTRPLNKHKPYIHEVQSDAWSGCWIGKDVASCSEREMQDRIKSADVIIFNVHGGGFLVGTPTMYMDSNIRCLENLENMGKRALIMSVKYGLAPEYRYPTPVDTTIKAYQHLLQDLKVPASKIIVTGDSAGGAIILEMLVVTSNPEKYTAVTTEGQVATPSVPKLSRPAGMILVSPLCSNDSETGTWITNEKYDYITRKTSQSVRTNYFPPDTDETKHRLFGILQETGGFKAWMPRYNLVYLGGRESMREMGEQFVAKTSKDGADVELYLEEEQVHDWFNVPEVVSDKTVLDRAHARWTDFVVKAVSEAVNQETENGVSDGAIGNKIPIRDAVEVVPNRDTDKALDALRHHGNADLRA